MNEIIKNNRQFAVHETQRLNQVTLPGTLTSRIETKQDKTTGEPYYYGFLQIKAQKEDIPVIFKKAKPTILKGSQVQLTGQWAQSNGSRPSFTCHNYQVLKEPSHPTLTDLQKQLQSLLKPSLERKNEWKERVDYLFKKKKDLEELEKATNLGEKYLQAHLLLKSAYYANYQTEHLPLTNFNQEKYLKTIASELEDENRRIKAAERNEVHLKACCLSKEVSHG